MRYATVFVLAALTAFPARAQSEKDAAPGPPASSTGAILNDDVYHAFSINADGAYTGSNVGANFEGPPDYNPPASCVAGGPANDGRNSVWWLFRPSTNGTVTIDLSGSSFDTILTVYTTPGSPAGACDDDGGAGTTSRIENLSVMSGLFYFVRVSGYQAASGTIQMAVSSGGVIQEPANDAFHAFYPFAGDNALPYVDTNVGASGPEAGEPSASCTFGGPGNDGDNSSAWRRFTATANGTVTIDLSGSSFDTLLLITTGDGNTELACDDDGGDGTTSRIANFPVTTGTNYRVRVSGYQGATGTIQYAVSGPIQQVTTVASEPGAPAAPVLALAAYPNPAAAGATVAYTLATPGEVSVEVFDVLGRRVTVLADGVRGAGLHEARWDARGVPAGVYVARVRAGEKVAAARLTVAR